MNSVPTALRVGFESQVELTIHSASLPAAGLFQCDPVAHVHLVTVKTLGCCPPSNEAGYPAASHSAGGGVRVTINSKEVGKTKQKLFTSHPVFEETIQFKCNHNSCLTSLSGTPPEGGFHQRATEKTAGAVETVEDYVVVTIEDELGGFYGEAYAPFSPHCPSSTPNTTPVRVMLLPRNAQDTMDPLFQQDMATLSALQLDDFGYVSMSWRVAMVPHGGALLTAEEVATTDGVANGAPPQFPLGLALKATWLAPSASYQRGAQFTTSVEFGGEDRFVFSATKPLFLTIQSATQLQRAIFHCTVQNVVHPNDSHDVSVSLPLPTLTASYALDRDLHWTAPVRSPQGGDYGMLIACIRLSRRPLDGKTPMCSDERCPSINIPQHQEAFSHVANAWDRPALPDTPLGAYQPLYWESESHIAQATERRWKQGCVVEAKPTTVHVRHLLDVLMGRSQLDAGVANVGASFFNRPTAELTPVNLKELMVACAFHAAGMNAQGAARFCFIALRRDIEDAVAVEEVHYILQHCLLGKTIEMPVGELERWVRDIFGTVTIVTYVDFMRYFVHNYAMWSAFGVPLTVDGPSSSAQRPHQVLRTGPLMLKQADSTQSTDHGRKGGRSPSIRVPATAAVVPKQNETSVWRTFVVRVQSTRKGFSVTASVSDSVEDVMHMVESGTGIAASRQEWRLNGETVLSRKALIGSTTLGLPSALKAAGASTHTQEVWIREREEAVTLTLIYGEKNKQWQVRFPVEDKVLQLRAAVQRKTMIPLSRCVLRQRSKDGARRATLQDRHPLSHYNLQSGDIVEVSQE